MSSFHTVYIKTKRNWFQLKVDKKITTTHYGLAVTKRWLLNTNMWLHFTAYVYEQLCTIVTLAAGEAVNFTGTVINSNSASCYNFQH